MQEKNQKTKLIYHNCSVYSPDGNLMFMTSQRRVNWYLKRNLAVVIGENPVSIKLTFNPAGKGEVLECLKKARENKCGVCGGTDRLSLHHVVPSQFRRLFPSEYKDHMSLFVVPLCRPCHDAYECHASKLKHQLLSVSGANEIPAMTSAKDHLRFARLLQSALQCHKKQGQVPPALIDKINMSVKENGIAFDCTKLSPVFDSDYVKRAVEDLYPKKESYILRDSEVVSKYGVENLIGMWSHHFITHVSGDHLGEGVMEEIGKTAAKYASKDLLSQDKTKSLPQ